MFIFYVDFLYLVDDIRFLLTRLHTFFLFLDASLNTSPNKTDEDNRDPQNRFDWRFSQSPVICLSHVPSEQCTISLLSDYFSKFGSVVNIQVYPGLLCLDRSSVRV